MAKVKNEQHRYGQHYTPRDVAMLLAALAVTSSDALVFDPACGDGRLLGEAINIKAHLSEAAPARKMLAESVFGVDLSPRAIEIAALTGARVACADFFDLEPGTELSRADLLPARFDSLIANPPYIRQELVGARDKLRIEDRLRHDRKLTPQAWWPRWSGRSDIYVYFFARSIRFLKAGGRLAFLTASSWLDSGYGAALREFLLRNFRIIAVIESAVESFFTDASINTLITVLEPDMDEQARKSNTIRFVQLTEPLKVILGQSMAGAVGFARLIERSDNSSVIDYCRARVIHQAVLERQASGWGKYLRADDILFHIIERGSHRMRHLSSLARVRYGVKTGANEFFYLRQAGEETVRKRKLESKLLSLNNVATVRRGLTTGANEFFYLTPVTDKTNAEEARSKSSPARKRRSQAKTQTGLMTEVLDRAGARHAIESEFLSPVVFSLREISGIILKRKQTAMLFFNCSLTKREITKTQALKYIRKGERAGFNRRPTCAARERWYAVAGAVKSAPLIFPSKVGERWVVALNRDGVFEDKKLYGVFPHPKVSRLLLAALLNSTWARYYAELTCRQMTGAQAIADIDVAVAEQILVADPRDIPRALKKNLEAALTALARRPVFSVFEEIKRDDRRTLDELVLAAIGFTNRAERKKVLDNLYAAISKVVRARIGKAANKPNRPAED